MRLVPAVTRALNALELFLRSSESLSVAEIAARLELPRTTAHELVHTLAARGYLSPIENRQHKYQLGLATFELGSIYAARLNLANEGRQVSQAVAAECGETVYVAVIHGVDVVYIAKEDSTQAVRLIANIGMRLPAHCTGIGKALLSGLSDEALTTLYGECEELVGMTPNSITSMSLLREQLSEVRSRGFAYDDCESTPGVQCVAAPVFNHQAAIVAAISIAVPTMRMSHERWAELADLVRSGADELSRRLGHRPGSPVVS